MSLAPGVRLGPYEILSAVAAGGMGEVYRARETALNREVAIKVLPEELAADAERLARFEAEARLASSLNHPNIVTIYGVGESGSVRYIAMELIEGHTLKDAMRGGAVEAPELIACAVQIASGLSKAHDAGIVHRDLKPRNVMITTDGLVKILDFGVSKLVRPIQPSDEKTSVSSLLMTVPGALIGTTDYMSPEQASGRPVDFRSDQFSFGTMLYEMASGKHPFHRSAAMQTLAAIIADEPESLARVNPAVPAALRTVIERCLKKDPERRYASTRDLLDELDKLKTSLHTSGHVRWLRGVAVAAAGVTLATLLAAGYMERGRLGTAAPPANRRNELAVLPFANVGADPANQAFADGLVETLTSKLTQLEQSQQAFWVVTASRRISVAGTSVRQAQQSFAATLAITGSVQRSADRLRLTVNLVDANTLRQIDARTLDVDANDIPSMQDGVVIAVTDLLGLRVEPQVREQLAAGGTRVPSAYDYYLQGKGYLQRFENIENIDSAIQLFTSALNADAKFALAHAGLAEAYWRRYEATHDSPFIQKARASCAVALGINGRLSPVHVTLGIIERGTGEYEGSVRELRQALAIDPMSGDALRELGRTYEALGSMADAEATYQQAIKVRPGDWTNHNDLGRFYFARGRYADAVKEFQEVVNLTPDNQRGYSNLGGALAQLQRFDEAVAAFQKSVALRPTDAAYSNLGTIYFRQQRYEQAARMFERAVALNGSNYRVWRNLAMSYFWAPGERDKANGAFARVASLAEQERKVNPRRPALLVDLAAAYARLGQSARARQLAAEAVALGSLDAASMFNLAVVFEDLGERDKALTWIGDAVKKGYPREQVEQSPSLADLRSDPRFLRMIQP